MRDDDWRQLQQWGVFLFLSTEGKKIDLNLIARGFESSFTDQGDSQQLI